MLFLDAFIGLSGPLIGSLFPEIQPWCRNSATYEKSHNELSSRRAVSVSVALNANEEDRGGTMRYCLQWMYRNGSLPHCCKMPRIFPILI